MLLAITAQPLVIHTRPAVTGVEVIGDPQDVLDGKSAQLPSCSCPRYSFSTGTDRPLIIVAHRQFCVVLTEHRR